MTPPIRRAGILGSTLLLLAACHRPAAVDLVEVRDLGVLETTDAVQGRDGGYSLDVGGRSVWFYGDTILSLEGEDGSAWRDNTWSWTDDLDATDGVTDFQQQVDARGAPVEFFAETREEAAYNAAHRGDPCEDPCGGREVLWPMASVLRPDGRALVFYVKIHGEPGAWNFFSRGVGIALWSDFELPPERPEPRVVDDEPTLLFAADEPSFGDAATIGPDEMLYAYGNDGGDLVKTQMLGRVDPMYAHERGAWEFWGTDGWSADLSKRRVVFDGASQESVFYDSGLHLWLALYEEEPGGDIVARTAEAPQGPWSEPVRLATPEPAVNGWPYSGIAHPEFQGDGILFTYYRDTGDWTGELRALSIELRAAR